MYQLRDNPEQLGLYIIPITIICFSLHSLLTILTVFHINMWTRAIELLFLRHRLCSRIIDDQPQGYAAFYWDRILHGNAGELGDL
jgi:hypothetical protein